MEPTTAENSTMDLIMTFAQLSCYARVDLTLSWNEPLFALSRIWHGIRILYNWPWKRYRNIGYEVQAAKLQGSLL